MPLQCGREWGACITERHLIVHNITNGWTRIMANTQQSTSNRRHGTGRARAKTAWSPRRTSSAHRACRCDTAQAQTSLSPSNKQIIRPSTHAPTQPCVGVLAKRAIGRTPLIGITTGVLCMMLLLWPLFLKHRASLPSGAQKWTPKVLCTPTVTRLLKSFLRCCRRQTRL